MLPKNNLEARIGDPSKPSKPSLKPSSSSELFRVLSMKIINKMLHSNLESMRAIIIDVLSMGRGALV